MRYPINLKPDTDGFVVSFPDIPEAITQVDTREKAAAAAYEALLEALEHYFKKDETVPEPGEITGDFVPVPASIASKVLLHNAFVSSGMTQVELANRMAIKKQEVTRLLNLRHLTKIDTIYKAMDVLGKYLVVTEQLDVYVVQGAPYQLERVLRKGTQVIFAANTLAKPSEIKFYSALIKQDEHLEASFVVIGDIREMKGYRPNGVKLERIPTSSIIGKVAALAVQCIIPE